MHYSSWKGFFRPKHPEKYRGDPKNIMYRSFLELKMMLRLDHDPGVKWWSSEEVIVPYKSPVDGARHRYFPDFTMKTESGVVMIEVKPSKQMKPPVKGKRVTKSYIEEVVTWGVNNAKWSAAEAYCSSRGWKFSIVTEVDLGVNYG